MAQRGLIDQYMSELIYAEVESDEDWDEVPLTDKDFAKAESQGLLDPKSLYLFVSWYQFGGPQRPPTIQELSELDAVILQDFTYLFGRLARARKHHDKRKSKH